MNNFASLTIAVLLLTTFMGCNMLKGAGKDIENSGKSIQKTVNHND